MINWANFISQCFNGLVLGALLALISSGLTIIYGTLGVLNLAHGAMFMLGGYAGWVGYTYSGSFIIAVIAGSLFVMLVGVVMERLVIRSFYGRPHEDQRQPFQAEPGGRCPQHRLGRRIIIFEFGQGFREAGVRQQKAVIEGGCAGKGCGRRAIGAVSQGPQTPFVPA